MVPGLLVVSPSVTFRTIFAKVKKLFEQKHISSSIVIHYVIKEVREL